MMARSATEIAADLVREAKRLEEQAKALRKIAYIAQYGEKK